MRLPASLSSRLKFDICSFVVLVGALPRCAFAVKILQAPSGRAAAVDAKGETSVNTLETSRNQFISSKSE
jgi:hypothetical protein